MVYFCVLKLCTINTFISSKCFSSIFLGFFFPVIMSFVNKNIFISFFTICVTFLFFSCPIDLTEMFSTKLNRNGDSSHSCLVPDLGGKHAIFHH